MPQKPQSGESESESESELLYDWRYTANQFVLAPSPLRPTTRIFIFQPNTCGYSPYVTCCLTRGCIGRLQLLLGLVSAVIFTSLERDFNSGPPVWETWVLAETRRYITDNKSIDMQSYNRTEMLSDVFVRMGHVYVSHCTVISTDKEVSWGMALQTAVSASGNALDSYSRGTQFRSRPERRLSWLRGFCEPL
jgi:hypothetical protein